MNFVEVLVGEPTYRRDRPLTYSTDTPLAPGSLAIVPLREKRVLGVVVRPVTKPSFTVKPVAEVPALPPLPGALLSLLHWLRDYYPAALGIVTQLFLPSELPKQRLETLKSPIVLDSDLPPLTKDQEAALSKINGPGLHVLHGETGSGKTRVYLELARQSLEAGKSAIILSPEIGLTSQLASDFQAVFGDRVVVVHSQLTHPVRRQRWQWLLEQPDPVIVIGARSALFSPLRNTGLIIIDEAHEPSYKQDQAPYYLTTIVAAKLADLWRAALLLGSATPSISDYYVATAKKRSIVRMTEPAKGPIQMQATEVVDLRDRSQLNLSYCLSDKLVEGLRQALHRKEQSLLFLNRRGTARLLFCQVCGWKALCPHCDLSLVYHGDTHTVRCHSCDFSANSPSGCPECRNPSIIFRGIGTKAVFEEVQRLLPDARAIRFDADNRKNERLEQHYEAVKRGDFDIVVGTQTLAKGLDLPRLSLVGVVLADTSLYFPDFSAQERTYQLLVQVIGRIGRGHRDGKAIIQTYTPDSETIKAVINKDWGGFYDRELQERRSFGFPPFYFVLKLSCRRSRSETARQATEELAHSLRTSMTSVIVEGPSPSFHEKRRGKYSWQLIIKAKQRTHLVEIVKQLPSGWSYDIDPLNLL